ncbi:MAG: hypothetical protein M3383_02535 [Actinomycetota bacterium]|nr:hypothetical protein [Actinomycetota bacterium]
MRKSAIRLIAAVTIVAVPAIALAETSLYTGKGTDDPQAKITLRVANNDGDRTIRRVTTEGLRYVNGVALCSATDRTPVVRIVGPFNVRENREFRAVGQATSGLGELRVTGELGPLRARGEMRFTFGKDGCRTTLTEWKARR